MEQVDFAGIISAAAVSTLGVLSLIVVALGVLAFYFFKGSGDTVKLGVWSAMLLAAGLFAAAVITKADPGERRTPDPGPSATATPQPSAPDDLADEPTPEPTLSPAPAPRPSDAGTIEAGTADISGRWHDDKGYVYEIAVFSDAFAVRQLLNGALTGFGQGTVTGRRLDYSFSTYQPASKGDCTATVSRDGLQINATCTSGGVSGSFTVER